MSAPLLNVLIDGFPSIEAKGSGRSLDSQDVRKTRKLWQAALCSLFLVTTNAVSQDIPNDSIALLVRWSVQQCLTTTLQLSHSPVIKPLTPNKCFEFARAFPVFPMSATTDRSGVNSVSIDTEHAPRISQPPQEEGQGSMVQWRPLMYESSAYLSVMHGFRFATEPSTRNGTGNNPFGYFASLGAMHGWSDGDGYFENYLGHPIQGAVSEYLWIHNDLRYRNVEFGNNRDYWMSRLRAYAFAWSFSEQFEIGLLSEASLGQIQRYCCAYGFVDHVITPNASMVWLIGGDIIDRYITRPLEDRTKSKTVRSLLRAGLNPPQSFANMLMLQYPWHRENRASPTDYDGELYLRPKSQASERFLLPLVPKFELTAAIPSYTHMGGHSCFGGSGIGAFRINDGWQWTVEVGGCTLGNSLPKSWSGDSLIFSAGPQWIMHNSSRWSPHAHFRMGGQKITQEYCQVDGTPMQGLGVGTPCNSEPDRRALHYESTGLAISTGGGLDIKINNALAFRVANVDYTYSWLHPVAGTNYNEGVRFSAGMVLRIGTW